MPDYHVPRGSNAKLDGIEGELKVGSRARIEAISGNLVQVSEGAYFDGAAEVNCDFECDSLRVGSGGILHINGNLTVHKLLDVNHSIEVSGAIKAGQIDVGGKIRAKVLSCARMRVGGQVEAEELLEVESINVGGKIEAPGTVMIGDFEVGGAAVIGGGKISGKIRVGGKFEARSRLEFGDLQVYGKTSLSADSKGSKISTTGQLSVSGDIDCDEISVFGRTEIHGSCKSKQIKVNGSLEVSGSLMTADLLEIYGSTEVDEDFEGTDVRVGGKFEARKILIRNEIDVTGRVEAGQGLKAKTVRVGSGSRVEGVIVAQNVDVGGSFEIVNWQKNWMGQIARARLVGKLTRVDDIYADEVRLGRNSRSERIFARIVEVEDDCTAGEITYTYDLRGDLERVHIEKPPVKVSRLPEPPI